MIHAWPGRAPAEPSAALAAGGGGDVSNTDKGASPTGITTEAAELRDTAAPSADSVTASTTPAASITLSVPAASAPAAAVHVPVAVPAPAAAAMGRLDVKAVSVEEQACLLAGMEEERRGQLSELARLLLTKGVAQGAGVRAHGQSAELGKRSRAAF